MGSPFACKRIDGSEQGNREKKTRRGGEEKGRGEERSGEERGGEERGGEGRGEKSGAEEGGRLNKKKRRGGEEEGRTGYMSMIDCENGHLLCCCFHLFERELLYVLALTVHSVHADCNHCKSRHTYIYKYISAREPPSSLTINMN